MYNHQSAIALQLKDVNPKGKIEIRVTGFIGSAKPPGNVAAMVGLGIYYIDTVLGSGGKATQDNVKKMREFISNATFQILQEKLSVNRNEVNTDNVTPGGDILTSARSNANPGGNNANSLAHMDESTGGSQFKLTVPVQDRHSSHSSERDVSIDTLGIPRVRHQTSPTAIDEVHRGRPQHLLTTATESR